MPFTIDRYRAGWKPNTNQGRIKFRSTTGQTRHIDITDPAEFAAILAILATSNSATIDDNGVIYTGAEEIDG